MAFSKGDDRVLGRLSNSSHLRRVVLPILARINPGDITIRHHLTGDPVHLHSFRHKGYWFHGFTRERAVLLFIARLVPSDAVVLHIGAHIGYTTLYLSTLAPNGVVHAFEPGANNLSYLKANVASHHNIIVSDLAVSDREGEGTLGVEDLTGRNNSMLSDMEIYHRNAELAFVRTQTTQQPVRLTTVDRYCERLTIRPSFIKIDTEGFEFEVLSGARRTLESDFPIVMVETTRRIPEVVDVLHGLGYTLVTAQLQRMDRLPAWNENVVAVHEEQHPWAVQFLSSVESDEGRLAQAEA